MDRDWIALKVFTYLISIVGLILRVTALLILIHFAHKYW
jgi:hypothetical protein